MFCQGLPAALENRGRDQHERCVLLLALQTLTVFLSLGVKYYLDLYLYKETEKKQSLFSASVAEAVLFLSASQYRLLFMRPHVVPFTVLY